MKTAIIDNKDFASLAGKKHVQDYYTIVTGKNFEVEADKGNGITKIKLNEATAEADMEALATAILEKEQVAIEYVIK